MNDLPLCVDSFLCKAFVGTFPWLHKLMLNDKWQVYPPGFQGYGRPSVRRGPAKILAETRSVHSGDDQHINLLTPL